MRLYVLLMLVVSTQLLVAECDIIVHNYTKKPVWARVYCVPSITGSIAHGGDLHCIFPNEEVSMTRPDKKLDCTRNLAFSYHESDLAQDLPVKEYNRLASTSIGITSGKRIFNAFSIAEKNGQLKGSKDNSY